MHNTSGAFSITIAGYPLSATAHKFSAIVSILLN
jgi:hypothetical protein